MTVFPEHPRLVKAPPQDGFEMRRLAEDHVTFVKFWLGWSLMVVVKAGYETDGATVSISKAISIVGKTCDQIKSLIEKYFPGEDVMAVYNRIVGTPWDMPRLLAAVVHDPLYSIKWCCRYICDNVYRRILAATKYEAVRREIEYDVIRLVGWQNWASVTEDEQEAARKFVVVKWVRTRKIPSIIENLKSNKKG